MMFYENRFTKYYFELVEFRKTHPSTEAYQEKHHIIPKSIGGSNSKRNVVSLSSREHVFMHLLLTRMCCDPIHKSKMLNAFSKIISGTFKIPKSSKFNSKLYGKLREKAAKSRSLRYSGAGNPFYGRQHTDESKRSMSLNNAARREDVRAKMRKPKAPHSRPAFSAERKANISIGNKVAWDRLKTQGYKTSEETKRKKSEAMKLSWARRKAEI